jgi:hypothetical protein
VRERGLGPLLTANPSQVTEQDALDGIRREGLLRLALASMG